MKFNGKLLASAAAGAMLFVSGCCITGKCPLKDAQKCQVVKEDVKLLLPERIVPITELKVKYLSSVTPRLHNDEMLIALSSSSVTNKYAQLAISKLPLLQGAQMHSSVLLPHIDVKMLRKLGIVVTSSPVYEEKL